MKRFFAALFLFTACLMAQAADTARQYYELRVYSTKDTNQLALVADYWQKAAVPA